MIHPRRKHALAGLGLALILTVAAGAGQEGKSVDQSSKGIERSSRIYIAPIEGGFDTFLAAAIIKKKGIEASFDQSEEHTSELQSHLNLVCRLLLEKKKNEISYYH